MLFKVGVPRWLVRSSIAVALLLTTLVVTNASPFRDSLLVRDLMQDVGCGLHDDTALVDDGTGDADPSSEDGAGVDTTRPLECDRLPQGRAHDLCLEEQALNKSLEQMRSSEFDGVVVIPH